MSRSLVKRGCAWRTTATPPTMTKSTPASTRRSRRRAGWKSVQLATRACPRKGQDARLAGHALEAPQTLHRRELELLANQALVDTGRPRRGGQDELVPQRVERVGDSPQGGVRVLALPRRDRRLRRSHAPGELALRDTGISPYGADQGPSIYRIHAI